MSLGKNVTGLKPIKARLLVPISIGLILLFTAFGFLLVNTLQIGLNEGNWETMKHASLEFKYSLAEQSKTLTALEGLLIRGDKLRKALREKDTSTLLLTYRDTYKELRSQYGITHFYFHGPDLVNLLRLHNPPKKGDKIDRFTARQAEETNQTTSGIELGPLGTFTLRVVTPVWDKGKRIGYLELGKEIEDILSKIHSRGEIEVAVTIKKNALSRSRWEEGMKMLERRGNWDRYPNCVLVYSSLPQFPGELDHYIPEDGHTHFGINTRTEFDNNQWSVLVNPLSDASGNEVGDLIILKNISKLIELRNTGLKWTIFGGLGLLILVLGLVYV